MSTKPRVAFIGNCQAQSLESLSGHLGVAIEVVPVPPVFDVPAFDRPEVIARVRSCDFVFNQRVAENYPLEFVRPSVLRSEFGSRSVSWPNVYFDGYFPQIEYLYKPSGKIVGPLSDYHFSFVRKAWAERTDVETLHSRFVQGDPAFGFGEAAERSLRELRIREVGLDLKMSDVVAAHWRHRKCLYTMNHPTNDVLRELLKRLLARAEVPVSDDDDLLARYPYPLNEISIPAFPSLYRQYGLTFAPDNVLRGKAMVRTDDGAWRMTHGEATYSWQSLFQQYYDLYDAEAAGSPEAAAILGRAAS